MPEKNKSNIKSSLANAKIMPHNQEAEQAVLCSALIDDEASMNICSYLKVDDFYTDSHKTIFESILNISKRNEPVDFVTVVDELEKNNALDSVGGIEYITTLTNVLPSAANHNSYMDIVKRDSILRQLIYSGQKIIENSYSGLDKEDALNQAEELVFHISEKEEVSKLHHISEGLPDVIKKFEDLAKGGKSIRGISTGIKEFDAITNGLQNSDLILLAARPGVGKTSFAMNIVTNAAINEKKKCAIFSLEMPISQIIQRSICSVGRVSMEKGLKGTWNEEEWKSLWLANKKLNDAGIYMDDNPFNTPTTILSKCRKLKKEKGLDLIMIDYLQLMNGEGKSNADNRQQQVSEMTRYLKIAAKELNVPIILLSQLSRAPEQRKGDHRPVLSDLRESGSIEQDADIVLFIYKADMYNDVESEDEPGICELIVAKHRNGSLGTVKMRWVGEYTTFIDKDERVQKPKTSNIKVVDDNLYGEAPPPEDNSYPGEISKEEMDDLRKKFQD